MTNTLATKYIDINQTLYKYEIVFVVSNMGLKNLPKSATQQLRSFFTKIFLLLISR